MIKSKFHKTLLTATMMVGGLMMGTGSAHATIFSAYDTLLFVPGSEAPPAGPGSFVSVTNTVLEWVNTGKATDAHSFLRIIAPPSNTSVNIASDGVWVPVAQLQHENNVIPVDGFGWSINMTDSFQLVGANFNSTSSDTLGPTILGVTFTETPNTLPCPLPNPLGSTCDDHFSVPLLNSVINSFLFTSGGETFDLSFRVRAAASSGTSFDALTNTIYTAENRTSDLFIDSKINKVPEPGSLALLGLGLAGLTLVSRRRAAKKDSKKA